MLMLTGPFGRFDSILSKHNIMTARQWCGIQGHTCKLYCQISYEEIKVYAPHSIAHVWRLLQAMVLPTACTCKAAKAMWRTPAPRIQLVFPTDCCIFNAPEERSRSSVFSVFLQGPTTVSQIFTGLKVSCPWEFFPRDQWRTHCSTLF